MKYQTILLVYCLVLLVSCSEKGYKFQSSKTSTFQDSQKAVEYFTNEMTFTTNPHGVMAAIMSGMNNFTVIDVRARKAYEAGHIPGAINLPVDEYNFDGDETNFPGLRTDGYNYVYCYALLCDLSQRAAKKFASLGYPVKEMKGGFEGWQEHHYPIEKKEQEQKA